MAAPKVGPYPLLNRSLWLLPWSRTYLERKLEVFATLQRHERVIRSSVLEVMSVDGHNPAGHHGAPGQRENGTDGGSEPRAYQEGIPCGSSSGQESGLRAQIDLDAFNCKTRAKQPRQKSQHFMRRELRLPGPFIPPKGRAMGLYPRLP